MCVCACMCACACVCTCVLWLLMVSFARLTVSGRDSVCFLSATSPGQETVLTGYNMRKRGLFYSGRRHQTSSFRYKGSKMRCCVRGGGGGGRTPARLEEASQ